MMAALLLPVPFFVSTMPTTPTLGLDDQFSVEFDEIVERVLVRYRPVLTHLVMGTFRSNLHRATLLNASLKAWVPRGMFAPVHSVGALTAGQVALLGGTRPTRALSSLAYRFSLALDGDDKRSMRAAQQLLHASDEAWDSLVAHHPITPVRGREAGVRRLRELARAGVAAQIAALLGAVREHQTWASRGRHEEQSEVIERHFLPAMRIFSLIRLGKRDQEVFRDYYLDARNLEELADEHGHSVEAEAARRLRFLMRFATAFEAAIDVVTGAVDPDGDPRTAHAIAGDAAEPKVLSPATARGGRQRTR